jgi:PAS domain-containing protein
MSAVFTPDSPPRTALSAPLVTAVPRTRTTPPNAPWGLCDVTLRADGRWDFVTVCARAVRILGAELSTLQTHPEHFWQRVDPGDLADVQRATTHAATTGELVKIEFRLVDGEQRRWVRWAALPERGADGRTVWVGCLVDVTAERPAGTSRGAAS